MSRRAAPKANGTAARSAQGSSALPQPVFRRYLACAALLAAGAGVQGAQSGPDAAVLSHGASVYERCSACHAIERNRTGPQHCGLFGRRAGTAPGFDTYSAAMRGAGFVWNAQTLDRFLRNPAAMVPGTTMGYAGIADARERADLIAWLRQATRACTPQG